MNSADKSVYDTELQKIQLDGKSWAAYIAITGVLAMSPSQFNGLLFSGTDTMNYQSRYEVMLRSSKTQTKEQEIDSIKSTIANALGLDIANHWLPNTGMDKECLFFQCNLDNETLSNYEKCSQLELSMYLVTKNILEKSKYFDMVAMI